MKSRVARRHIGWLAIVAAISWLPGNQSPALAQSIIGVASVIDGDTIEIRGQRIRLHAVDAPESKQTFQRSDGAKWRCGQRAAFALADKIGRSPVRCDPRGRDRYDRIIAICFKGDIDLNEWLVSRGWAVAYRRFGKDYVAAEDGARAGRQGNWSGQFTMPWDWRAAKRGS